mgnify:CR=1 FL=1
MLSLSSTSCQGGDVIPKVTGVASLSTSNLTADEKKQLEQKVLECFKRDKNGSILCPCVYSTTLEKEAGKADYFCVASDCPEQRVNKILHFTSRKAMDIEGTKVNCNDCL